MHLFRAYASTVGKHAIVLVASSAMHDLAPVRGGLDRRRAAPRSRDVSILAAGYVGAAGGGGRGVAPPSPSSPHGPARWSAKPGPPRPTPPLPPTTPGPTP